MVFFMMTWQAFVPPEALESIWTDDFRKSWGMKLHTSSSASELLQVLLNFYGYAVTVLNF